MDRDWQSLGADEQQRFRVAVTRFVEDPAARRPFRPGLRVKAVQGTADIMEMTFAPDGRATWQFGVGIKGGQVHVVWRRIGTHDIFRSP